MFLCFYFYLLIYLFVYLFLLLLVFYFIGFLFLCIFICFLFLSYLFIFYFIYLFIYLFFYFLFFNYVLYLCVFEHKLNLKSKIATQDRFIVSQKCFVVHTKIALNLSIAIALKP